MALSLSRLNMLARFGGVILATLPNTLLPVPVPFTLAFTKRFGREKMLTRLHFQVAWARFCRKHLLKYSLTVDGREHLPDDRRGYMVISNHQSYVDIMVLMEALGSVSFLSKTLVKYIPLIGLQAYVGGTIFFDRKHKDSRKQALEDTIRMCRESTATIVFPEGTRSADGELRDKIYPSAIEAAYQNGFKVIPVGLDGTFKILPKAMDRVNLGQQVAVNIGQALDPADYPDQQAWVDAVWSRVGELYRLSRASRR